jgi:hypothetical protein
MFYHNHELCSHLENLHDGCGLVVDSYGWKSEYVHGLTQSLAFIVEGEPAK